jgi:putative membrane protein (TIGR04086 family)
MKKEENGELWLNRITSLAAGTLLAFAACALVLFGGGALITSGRVGEDWLQGFCLLGAFVGCLIGGCYAALREGRRALIVALGVSLLFVVAWLVIGATLYDALSLERGLPLLGVSLLGAVPAGVLGASGKRNGKRRNSN